MWRLLLPGLLGLSASAVAATEQFSHRDAARRAGPDTERADAIRMDTQGLAGLAGRTRGADTSRSRPADCPVAGARTTGPGGRAVARTRLPATGGVHVRADTDERTQAEAALLQGWLRVAG